MQYAHSSGRRCRLVTTVRAERDASCNLETVSSHSVVVDSFVYSSLGRTNGIKMTIEYSIDPGDEIVMVWYSYPSHVMQQSSKLSGSLLLQRDCS